MYQFQLNDPRIDSNRQELVTSSSPVKRFSANKHEINGMRRLSESVHAMYIWHWLCVA